MSKPKIGISRGKRVSVRRILHRPRCPICAPARRRAPIDLARNQGARGHRNDPAYFLANRNDRLGRTLRVAAPIASIALIAPNALSDRALEWGNCGFRSPVLSSDPSRVSLHCDRRLIPRNRVVRGKDFPRSRMSVQAKVSGRHLTPDQFAHRSSVRSNAIRAVRARNADIDRATCLVPAFVIRPFRNRGRAARGGHRNRNLPRASAGVRVSMHPIQLRKLADLKDVRKTLSSREDDPSRAIGMRMSGGTETKETAISRANVS